MHIKVSAGLCREQCEEPSNISVIFMSQFTLLEITLLADPTFHLGAGSKEEKKENKTW